jgi:hypothetical protein
VLAKASNPGMDGGCKAAELAAPPTIHRLDLVVLLAGIPLELGGLGDWRMDGGKDRPAAPIPRSTLASLGLLGMSLPDALGSIFGSLSQSIQDLLGTANRGFRRPWELRQPLWGLQVGVEQAWFPLGVTVGEPIGSISLAPAEERKIEVFSWQRRKATLDLESTEIVDRQTSTQLTTHDSYQVATRVQKEFHWEAHGEVSKTPGVAVGGSAGGSVTSSVDRQFQHTRELTKKVSEQLRSERKVKIGNSEETGTERRETQTLRNPNECHSVAYNYYEQLNHYRVRHAVAELNYVLIVPNPLPELTPAWVTCYEGLLRDALLDPSMAAGLDAARRLTAPSTRTMLAQVAQQLEAEFRPAPPPSDHDDDDGGILGDILGGLGDLADAVLGGLGALAGGLLGGADGEKAPDPTLALGPHPTTDAVRGFLRGVAAEPTMAGLLYALVVLRRYYGSGALPAGLDRAVGQATSLLASQGVGPRPSVTESETLAAAAVEERNEQREQEAERRRDEADFERLQCHLEHNLLYYLRGIWSAEDPAQRYARLAGTVIAGRALWDLVENRPLGFHLNGTIFPVQLGAPLEQKLAGLIDGAPPDDVFLLPDGLVRYAEVVPAVVTDVRTDLARAVGTLDQERRTVATPQLFQRSIQRAQTLVLAERILGKKGAPDRRIEEGARLLQLAHEDLAKAAKLPLLSPEEEQVRLHVDGRLGQLQAVVPDRSVVSTHLGAMVELGQWSRAVEKLEDFIASLPTGSVYVEATVGHCTACGAEATRALEARVGLAEAQRRAADAEATRRERKLEGNDLSPNPPDSALALSIDVKRTPGP